MGGIVITSPLAYNYTPDSLRFLDRKSYIHPPFVVAMAATDYRPPDASHVNHRKLLPSAPRIAARETAFYHKPRLCPTSVNIRSTANIFDLLRVFPEGRPQPDFLTNLLQQYDEQLPPLISTFRCFNVPIEGR